MDQNKQEAKQKVILKGKSTLAADESVEELIGQETLIRLPEANTPEEELFDCDLFLFTASRGVPPVSSGISDVRMAQFEANREIIRTYARKARESRFQGMFCQISDPVDLLCREVFLLPSQLQHNLNLPVNHPSRHDS